MENYNFGEKTEELMNGVKCPVWQTPRYLEAKTKVIETLESDKYKGILKPSDFWILMNTYANKTKVMYSGLIISHNGCLKINDTLEKPFNPKALTIDKEGFNGSLVYTYCDDDIYEVGEVNQKNCKNDYPYAMALKRCFDRVVLKKCKLAYSGIYSDSEAEEFKEDPKETQPQENTEKAPEQKQTKTQNKAQNKPNSASSKQQPTTNETPQKSENIERMTGEQCVIIYNLEDKYQDFLCKKFKLENIAYLSKQQAESAIEFFKSKGVIKNDTNQ